MIRELRPSRRHLPARRRALDRCCSRWSPSLAAASLGLVVAVLRVVAIQAGQLAGDRLHQPDPGHAAAGPALRLLLRPAAVRLLGRRMDGGGPVPLDLCLRPSSARSGAAACSRCSQRQWEAGASLGLTYRQRLGHVDPAAGDPRQHRADRRLPGAAGEGHVADLADRLRRADPRQPDHQLPPPSRRLPVYLTAAAIYFVICFSLSQLSQHAGEEDPCRSLRSTTSTSASAPSRC